MDTSRSSGRLSRRRMLGGLAAGGAAVAFAGYGASWRALAQEATPTAGCLGPAPTITVTPVAAGTKISVALVPKLVHPFFEDCRIGADQKAKELGVDFQWVVPQTGDPAIQVQMIEDLVRKQVHAIVISPNEPTSVEPVIADAVSKGILVMTFDSDSPNSQRVIYIGTDNKTAGTVQGQTLSELLGGTGKIGIITGGLGALNLNQRIEGLKEGIGSRIEIVDTVATDDDLAKGLSVSESLLRAHGDLNGIACMSATGGPTLAQVIRGPEFSDRIGTLKIVAFDDLAETVAGIKDGILDATMVQRPVQMGVLSIQWAYDILTGAATPSCTNIDTGVTVVTKDNLTTYTK
ncbi:MAG: ribose transport system substrate-binding protein [Thermomicrobiales bacterium]|nr:ribose transport system substrate-binding protein [Thermomicrobiales bacterium]